MHTMYFIDLAPVYDNCRAFIAKYVSDGLIDKLSGRHMYNFMSIDKETGSRANSRNKL